MEITFSRVSKKTMSPNFGAPSTMSAASRLRSRSGLTLIRPLVAAPVGDFTTSVLSAGAEAASGERTSTNRFASSTTIT